MNKDQAKNFIDVIRAFNDGKQIQVKVGNEWKDINDWHFGEELRIKPEKEPKEKHYRPFEDDAELMLHYAKHFNHGCACYVEPLIWVKKKVCSGDERSLITAYDINCVFIQDVWIDLTELFEEYTFLDGSACGVEE